MNDKSPFARWVAARLAKHAAGALPPHRSEWARAMRSEVEHVEQDRAAVVWAMGCVFGGYRERIVTMHNGNINVSRWVLGLEMLVCFAPLTLMFGALLSRGAFMRADPVPWAAELVVMTVMTALGPLGLAVAFNLIVLDRKPIGGVATIVTLCALAVWLVLSFGFRISNDDYPGGAWREYTLLALLPAVGAAHLAYLVTRVSRRAASV